MLKLSTALALCAYLLVEVSASVIETRQAALTQYIVYNQCPASINLYIAGQNEGTIAQGGNTTKFLPANAGFFYTDANGGRADGTRTVRAGFFGERFYYYLVRDPAYTNVGMVVQPINVPQRMGYCVQAGCTDAGCSAFDQPPTAFPPSGSTAPPPPLYQCPFANTTYTISFCPGGRWPGSPARTMIHPGFNNPGKCLDVRGGTFANGTPVQIYDCNGTAAQNWVISRGSTKVQLAGTNFCLDAGSNPANGVGLKIWQCYNGLAAQQWVYTDDNRIALQGRGLCVDLPNGNLANGNQIQTWQCTDNNPNQVWTL